MNVKLLYLRKLNVTPSSACYWQICVRSFKKFGTAAYKCVRSLSWYTDSIAHSPTTFPGYYSPGYTSLVELLKSWWFDTHSVHYYDISPWLVASMHINCRLEHLWRWSLNQNILKHKKVKRVVNMYSDISLQWSLCLALNTCLHFHVF
jgi:hypothetical protein